MLRWLDVREGGWKAGSYNTYSLRYVPGRNIVDEEDEGGGMILSYGRAS